MPSLTHFSAYHFAPLTHLGPLSERLLTLCKRWHLRGTVLLSPEGLNLFVTGERGQIYSLHTELRSITALESLESLALMMMS